MRPGRAALEIRHDISIAGQDAYMMQDDSQQPTAPIPEQPTVPSPKPTHAQRKVAKAAWDRNKTWALVIALFVAGLVLVGVALGAWYYNSLANKLSPVDSQTAAEVASVLDTGTVETAVVATPPEYILLLGSDARPGQTRARSDSIVIARIQKDTKKVTLLSIPRDTRVPIPGHGQDKITHANAFGGPALAITTVKAYTGLPINHYVELNFAGFADIVDALGGVTVNVDRAIDDPHGANTGGVSNVTYVPAGRHKLSGPAALTYVRARHIAGGDLARMKHQQTFLKALATQVLATRNLHKLPGVIDSAADNITTDMKVSKIVALAQEYQGFSGKSIESYSATGHGGTVNGVYYIIPNSARSERLFRAFEAGTPPSK
jgi:LCP family protein required for cell wall assembly